MLTQELAHKFFEYKDGDLYWKVDRLVVRAGELAGAKTLNGYKQIGINRKVYLQHRVIFLMFHGYLPKYVDHINGNRNDNRIENLREVTSSQNNCNRKVTKKTKYPVRGIYQHSKYKDKYCVEIYVDKKRKHIGIYKTLEEAIKASNDARQKYHKEFAYNAQTPKISPLNITSSSP